MTDVEKLEGIANFLEVQGSPAFALSLRQIAARSRKIDEVIQRIAEMLEPDLDSGPRAAIDCKQIIADGARDACEEADEYDDERTCYFESKEDADAAECGPMSDMDDAGERPA